jgi:hypothetical protein
VDGRDLGEHCSPDLFVTLLENGLDSVPALVVRLRSASVPVRNKGLGSRVWGSASVPVRVYGLGPMSSSASVWRAYLFEIEGLGSRV